ncbi:MAG: metal-transporting ATPase, partial [Lactimicrobium massiliense]
SAIGAGTDVASDSSDVVLMNSKLSDVAAAVRLSRATLRNIHENLFWAFFYNVICIPLAAGLYAWKMNPMVGAAAMSLSSFTVCMNALRLNLFNMHRTDRDHAMKNQVTLNDEDFHTEKKDTDLGTDKEDNKMEKVLHVDGMMCEHCEARVKKALESVDGVVSAKADRNAKTAVVELSKDVDNAALKKAVEDQDYQVTGIE